MFFLLPDILFWWNRDMDHVGSQSSPWVSYGVR